MSNFFLYIESIKWVIIFVPLIALLFGLILALAAKFLSVTKDERIEKIEVELPGINCGICGFPGCSSYAEAIVTSNADINLCIPGGFKVNSLIGTLMGLSLDGTKEKRVAYVACKGNHMSAEYKFDYNGLDDCRAKHLFFGGDKACPFGCLGGGSCISVCPVNAIASDGLGLVSVKKDKCIGCEKCILVCPTGVIQMIPKEADVVVACHSKDKGGVVKKYCTVGCIGCKICDRKSPEGGFIIEDFLAHIDYDKDGDRYEGKKGCPMKCIVEHS